MPMNSEALRQCLVPAVYSASQSRRNADEF